MALFTLREIDVDTPVALVQAYLNINGYFTVVEYPVLEASRGGGGGSATDLDVLAFRFPHAGHEVIRGGRHRPLGNRAFEPDRVLGCAAEHPDMIVGEVKEGSARFNPATRNPLVLEVALARFGCCPPDQAAELARRLLARGKIETAAGHAIRMVAFGAAPDPGESHWLTVSMSHVVRFLRSYLREYWDVLRHVHVKEEGLSVLALLEKWGEARQPEPVVERDQP